VMVVLPADALARKNPFSEKDREKTGPSVSKEAAISDVLTLKMRILPSLAPAARRFPSGWNWQHVSSK
jgi:hypothetical protein